MSSSVPSKPVSSAVAIPAGAPAWITSELLEDTLRTWQPYYNDRLTTRDALEILLDAGRLLELLESNDEQESISGTSAGLQS